MIFNVRWAPILAVRISLASSLNRTPGENADNADRKVKIPFSAYI
jgi:hypothetical protein